MSTVYAASMTRDDPTTALVGRPRLDQLTPQALWEALVGVRDRFQRAWLLDPSIAYYGLDRTLRSGRVVKTVGQVVGDRCYLALVVALSDGTHLAASIVLDRTARRPVVSAVVMAGGTA